jgi:hypothetical protein
MIDFKIILKGVFIVFTLGSQIIYNYIQHNKIISLENKIKSIETNVQQSIELTHRACQLTLEKVYNIDESD